MAELNSPELYPIARTIGYVHEWTYPIGCTYRFCPTCGSVEHAPITEGLF